MIMTDERGQAMKPSSLKFKTIVVATDLTDKASSALCYAQALARLHTSTLVVVHVIDPLGYAFPEGAPAFLAADKAAREELAKIEQGVRAQGIPIHSVMESGIVCERILQALNDHHGDLLVLGTRAKTEAGRVALGTIARQLLALHVSKCGSEDTCSHCLERLRFLAPFNESHTVPVDHIVVTGDAGKVIAEHAQKLHADLVVLGSPVDELMEEDFASSTVLQVISNVKCPVLCVPSTVETPAIEMITEVAFQC
jgi:nucleotide-binding universal stress UspA family protein